MASGGIYSVTFDEALEAMRLTALDMSSKYKETSLSVSTFLVGSSSLIDSHFRVSRYVSRRLSASTLY